MNVNENVPVFGRERGKVRQLKVVPIQWTLMGPPLRPAPKRKESSTSAHTTSSSSNINWRQHQKSTQNNSTTLRTSFSSRSRSSTEPESRVVIALSEGRGEAVGEVGIAAINIARPSLILCQISDSQSYINTLTKINILNPSEILVPLTFIESFTTNRLIEKVKEQFHDVKITGVTRNTFNKTTGLQHIKQLCVPSMNSILLILQHRYYALAAAAALLTYTETTLYVTYASESIKIEYQESEGSTIIDVATADRLELVASARPTMKKRFSCLFDVLNHCVTKIGGRTLRASILQPPCSVPDIEARLDCVTELVEHSDMLAAIQVALSKLTNIDQLLTLATVMPDQAQSCSERQINYILLLNTVLEQIAPLQDIFENSKQQFFIELRATLSNPAFTEIKDLLRTLIHTDAHPGKGQYGMFQRCFAIKSGINSLLDLVRKSYSERLEDMRNYITNLGERYSLALTLHNNHKKGYHILLNLNAHQKKTLKKNDLPPECIQVERLANSYTMKTQELVNLSSRVEDIMAEILKISNIMIHKLLMQIREHIGMFYKLCEDIAKLDMLQSLAKASSAMHYVRPQFADYLEVRQARHPLLDFLCSTEPSANSMYASKEYNINIITGPNGSGKSILVRQVILLQVMAQVGCYVPAQSATLRVSDRILARVYLEDNMDCGASAFVLEMKEIQYFLTVLTRNTLIIIDELCRSTSVEEGTALAMAICEKLMKSSAFVFFTTHFKFLTKLQDLHFCVKTWQLETLTETIDNQMVLRFTYNVIPGVTSLEHYGIFLAKGTWPENIIKYAEEILKKLSKSHKRPSPRIEQANAAARLKYDLEAEFQMLKAKTELTRTKISEKLMGYQRNLESLGHQVEILFIADQMNDDNRLSIYENDNSILNTVPIGDRNVSQNLIQANSDYPLNQIEEFVDYFNLQRQSPYSNMNISQNFNQAMVNSSNMQNRNMFENLHGENEEIPQHLFNFQDDIQEIKDFNQQRPSNSFYKENLRFPPPTQPFLNNVNPKYFQNNNECQGTSTAPQDYYENLSNYSNSLNNSVISERIAHLEGARMMNESLDLSYSNIFEPEIILETNDELQLNYSNVQSVPAQQKNFVFQKELTTVGQKATFITQENIFMTSLHRNLTFAEECSYTSKDNSVLSREDFVISKEGSIAFRENSIISRRDSILSKENSIYEDAMSEYLDSNSGFINRGSDDYLERPINANVSKRNDESFLSITEQQFSLPLQQHVERTSTPINFVGNSRSQPLPVWSQTDMNFSNSLPTKSNKLNRSNFEQSVFKTSKIAQQSKLNSAALDGVNNWSAADHVNTTQTSIKKTQQPKSDSTKSDSIKWVNVFATPTIFRTPKSYGQSNSTSFNDKKMGINQASPHITTNVKSIMTVNKNTSSNNTNSKTSTDSIIWNVEKKVKNTTFDMQKSTHNVSDTHYYSEADITEVLNDLQSCSEYFSESQDWDFVDEEVNSKLNQQANVTDKIDLIRRPIIDGIHKNDTDNKMLEKELKDHSEYQPIYQQNSKSQEQKDRKEIKPVASNDGNLTVSGPDLQKKKNPNVLENNNNVDPNGHQFGKKRTAIIQRKKKVPFGMATKDRKRMLKTKNIGKELQYTKPVTKSQPHKICSYTKTESREGDKKNLPEKIPSLVKAKTQSDKRNNIHLTKFQWCERSHPEQSDNEIRPQYDKVHDISSLQDIAQSYENTLIHQHGNGQDENMQQNEVSRFQNNTYSDKNKALHPKTEDHLPSKTSERLRNEQIEQILNYETCHSQYGKEFFDVNDETHQQQWDGNHEHCKEIPYLQIDEVYFQQNKGSQFDSKISEPQSHKEASQTEGWEGTKRSEEIHIKPYPQNLQRNEVTQKSNCIEKLHLPQHGSKFDIEISQCHEEPHQRKHTKATSQSFSDIPQLKCSKEKLHQSPRLKFFEDIDQLNYDILDGMSQSQHDTSGKTVLQPHHPQNECVPSQTMIEKNVQQQHNDENMIPSGDSKSTQYLQNGGNENKDPSITHFHSGSNNTPAFDQSKEDNQFCKQSQSEQINRDNETHQKKNVGSSQNSSLEPLGDIHLELFSDESIFDESQNQTSNEIGSLKKSPSLNSDKPLPTKFENLKEICPADDGNSKILCEKNVNTTTDEYETAHSILISSQQDSIFFNTPCSVEQASASTPVNKKREQSELSQTKTKSKRRRLGYVTEPLLKNPQEISPIPEVTNKPTFNKETSPDIFEESTVEIFPLYKDASEEMSQTPSDFESSKNTKPNRTVKKSKWISPLKTNNKNSDEPKVLQKKLQCKSKISRFKPPRKLTKKEIEIDFYEQDKKMLESEDSAQYLERIINRPTVRQLQQTKHIASIHKTSSGVVVVPAKEPKTRKRKFVVPLKKRSENFDITLFSDKNSDKFEQFMNKNNGEKIINVRQDVANQVFESEVVSKMNNQENVSICSKSTDTNASVKVCKDKDKVKILQNIQLASGTSTAQKSENVKHRKQGYYTQNKKRIDNIVDKYLKPEIESTCTANATLTSSSQKKISQKFNSSYFSQSTVVLDIDDD